MIPSFFRQAEGPQGSEGWPSGVGDYRRRKCLPANVPSRPCLKISLEVKHLALVSESIMRTSLSGSPVFVVYTGCTGALPRLASQRPLIGEWFFAQVTLLESFTFAIRSLWTSFFETVDSLINKPKLGLTGFDRMCGSV
jgi:hypothetical protein